MKKYLLIVSLLTTYHLSSLSQPWDTVTRQKVDSLIKVMKSAGSHNKVDCLNRLASIYVDVWDDDNKLLDTACLFANQALNEAKKGNYKRGLGYAYIQMESCFGARVDDDRNNNNLESNYIQAEKYARQAIAISEEIKDYSMAGDAYNFLKWMERWKGDPKKYKKNVL